MAKLVKCFGNLCLILSLTVISAIAQESPRLLLLDSPVERELAGGQREAFTVKLAANQIARVRVEQKGIDVLVSVVAPDGAKLFDVDRPTGAAGEETATIAAQQSGMYRIEIRALEKSAPTGRYRICLDKFLTESEYLTERLAAVGRLWGAIKYFHPYLAYKNIDWDGALVRAIPLIKTARTPNEYRQAIGGLLQVLSDPATAIIPVSIEDGNQASGAGTSKAPTYFRIIDEHLVISVSDWTRARANNDRAALARQPAMISEVTKAKGIVLDCRYQGVSRSEVPSYFLRFYLNSVLPFLVQGDIMLGTDRYRVHSGYAPQRGNSSGGYTSSFVTQAPGIIAGQAGSKKPLAVIIDEKTPDLVPLLSGLQASGARIIQVGSGSRDASARTLPMLLADGVNVRIRLTEFVDPNGGSIFHPNVQVDSGSDERVISAAIASINDSGVEKEVTTTNSLAAPMLNGSKDAPYAQMTFPTEEYRLLALFRFWNVINYFFPYKHLTDKPWDTVLSDFIPRFLENQNQLDYEMTVAEMVARLQDTHGFVGPLKQLDAHLGGFAPPISLLMASGRLIVANLLDEKSAQAAGVQIGDAIISVDGEPIEQRIAYLSKFKSLSTSSSAYRYVHPTALRGAKDSTAKLCLEGVDGRIRNVEIARTVGLGSAALPAPRKTPVYQVLPNGYGYIDLARLPLADAHKSMDAVMNTPALIFDMRGYPNGTAWEIGPRLSEKKSFAVAQFRRPLQDAAAVVDEDLEGSAPEFFFEQKMPIARGAAYKGKVVVLINEDAISQSEHTCLFFEAATNVTFIGSATNGANGDVTSLVLPGGIYVSFSGHDVRHADGRQLQRIGIQPHIKVEPTAKDIREGRDEVFEAAVRYLEALKK
jgi:C-terminal processing protease CtpA/Prc